MSDLGWRAQSSQLSRHAKPIEGLREDFGIRLKAAVEALGDVDSSQLKRPAARQRGKLKLGGDSNKGVEARAQRDLLYLETDEAKEQRRLATLERKAAQYDALSRGVDLDDEAANDLHEVDFIAKNLAAYMPEQTSQADDGALPPEDSLHPELLVERQQAMRRKMQGGGREEYSTYEQDVSELEARHKKVDELDEMNAKREAEFEEARKREVARDERKQKQTAKHKAAILQQLLKKRQKVGS